MGVTAHHKGLDAREWQKFPIEYQLGNIGSELTRARVLEEKGDIEQRNRALERALELLDMTTSAMSPQHEVVMMRNVVRDKLKDAGTYACPLALLERYCLPFAFLARKNI